MYMAGYDRRAILRSRGRHSPHLFRVICAGRTPRAARAPLPSRRRPALRDAHTHG